jgi:hypothetical protein
VDSLLARRQRRELSRAGGVAHTGKKPRWLSSRQGQDEASTAMTATRVANLKCRTTVSHAPPDFLPLGLACVRVSHGFSAPWRVTEQQ